LAQEFFAPAVARIIRLRRQTDPLATLASSQRKQESHEEQRKQERAARHRPKRDCLGERSTAPFTVSATDSNAKWR
jgi:hypothetical protein